MTIDYYKRQIEELRKFLDLEAFDDRRANQFWKDWKIISDQLLKRIVDHFISISKDNQMADGFESYTKQLFDSKDYMDQNKAFDNCCDRGLLFTRTRTTNTVSIFRCDCLIGRNTDKNFPIWDKRFEKDYER